MLTIVPRAQFRQSSRWRWPSNGLRLFHWFFKKFENQTYQASQHYASEATFELGDVYKCIRLERFPKETITINKDLAVKMYTKMMYVRRLEEVANSLYREKIVRGFCHLYTGQEAVCVGIHSAMKPDDSLITAYRCHGWSYLLDISPLQILAELAGRETGCQRGKGGSMHMYSKRFYGGNGIVGAQVPLGVGIGLALKNNAKGNVCFALYGDGAANQGQIFEAFNIACLWRLPVIFVCENNEYGMGTKMHRSSCSIEYYKRGIPLPGIYVDGMDVFAMRNATEFAIDFVLKEGPIVIEAHTYRYFGHSMSDPGTSYRSRDEVSQMRSTRDPIINLREKGIAKGLLTEEECKKIDAAVRQEMKDAGEKVKKDKEVKLEELWADIYMDNKEAGIRDTIGNRKGHFRAGKTMEKDHIKLKSFKPDLSVTQKRVPLENVDSETQVKAVKVVEKALENSKPNDDDEKKKTK